MRARTSARICTSGQIGRTPELSYLSWTKHLPKIASVLTTHGTPRSLRPEEHDVSLWPLCHKITAPISGKNPMKSQIPSRWESQ
jgi:hypothetical protein